LNISDQKIDKDLFKKYPMYKSRWTKRCLKFTQKV
jgi:hypothetical protein